MHEIAADVCLNAVFALPDDQKSDQKYQPGGELFRQAGILVIDYDLPVITLYFKKYPVYGCLFFWLWREGHCDSVLLDCQNILHDLENPLGVIVLDGRHQGAVGIVGHFIAGVEICLDGPIDMGVEQMQRLGQRDQNLIAAGRHDDLMELADAGVDTGQVAQVADCLEL